MEPDNQSSAQLPNTIENNNNNPGTASTTSAYQSFNTSDVAEQEQSNKRSSVKEFLFGHPKAYVAEYVLLLVIIGSLVGCAISMFGTIIDYIGAQPNSRFGGGWAYTTSIAMLASVTVLIPAFILFTRRTKSLESVLPSIKGSGWRRGMLSLFLLIIAMNAIGYSITFFYDLFSWLASFGLGGASKAIAWKSIIKHIFAIVLFTSTALLYAKDYRATNQEDPTRQVIARIYRYLLVIVVFVLAIVFLLVPLKAQRGSFIDQAIVNDIRTIHTKVADYDKGYNGLPNKLDDMTLNDEIKSRAKSYGYEYNTTSGSRSYEICAVFKTDTSKKDGSGGNILEQFSSSYYNTDGVSTTDPSIHKKGRVCFTYQSTNYSSSLYKNPSYDSSAYDNSYAQ